MTKAKCLKHAISVGNSHFSRAFGRTACALELAAYRAAALRCVFDFGSGPLSVRPDYAQLEATEKMNLSFWVGMTFASIAAEQILRVPRLIHATRQHGIIKANKKSRSLADLVGTDSAGDWHVIEAKGRKTFPSVADLRDWKAQSRTIRSINGANVSTRSVCIGRIASPVTVHLIDPPSDEGNVNLQFSSQELSRYYYQPYMEFLSKGAFPFPLQANAVVLARQIAADPIDGSPILVGLRSEHHGAIASREPAPIYVEALEGDDYYVGSDGVVVMTLQSP